FFCALSIVSFPAQLFLDIELKLNYHSNPSQHADPVPDPAAPETASNFFSQYPQFPGSLSSFFCKQSFFAIWSCSFWAGWLACGCVGRRALRFGLVFPATEAVDVRPLLVPVL